MFKYKCEVCGYVYDESAEDISFVNLDGEWKCPICGAPMSMFKKQIEVESKKILNKEINVDNNSIEYDNNLKQDESKYEEYMSYIHDISVKNESIVDPMSTTKKVIGFEDILIMGASLNPLPLNDEDIVNTRTIIGKNAKKPMILEMPIYISHMSFGALSREAKISLAKGSAMAKTAMCSGEGGILVEEKDNSYKYIFEYVPNLYSVNDENLKSSSAIEIKISQGTKPGMGGHLPGEKVTEEISNIRGKEIGKDIHSPSKFKDIHNKEDLKKLVDELRIRSEGLPIGIKIAAGNIEDDLEWIKHAMPDFITIDGRGGATGASPKVLKDSSSIPTIYALYRARKYLDNNNLDIDLVITGGLRISSDFAKAIAMGATAVAISTSALISIACQQYRVCGTGKCPVGIATQDEDLRKKLKIDVSAKRLYNFLNTCNSELKMFGRITGNNDIHKLSVKNLKTTNSEISNYTNIDHV